MRYNKADALSSGVGNGGKFSLSGRFGDKIFFNLALAFALLIVVLLVGLIIVLNIDAMPAIEKFGFSFLRSMEWDRSEKYLERFRLSMERY